MSYKFEKLEVWQLSLEYSDVVYKLVEKLPRSEEYNLKSQILRAATSISLNIAEGSIGQSNPEQKRFINMSIRSCVETVACLNIMKRRKYIDNNDYCCAYSFSEKLFAKMQAFKRSLK